MMVQAIRGILAPMRTGIMYSMYHIHNTQRMAQGTTAGRGGKPQPMPDAQTQTQPQPMLDAQTQTQPQPPPPPPPWLRQPPQLRRCEVCYKPATKVCGARPP